MGSLATISDSPCRFPAGCICKRRAECTYSPGFQNAGGTSTHCLELGLAKSHLKSNAGSSSGAGADANGENGLADG